MYRQTPSYRNAYLLNIASANSAHRESSGRPWLVSIFPAFLTALLLNKLVLNWAGFLFVLCSLFLLCWTNQDWGHLVLTRANLVISFIYQHITVYLSDILLAWQYSNGDEAKAKKEIFIHSCLSLQYLWFTLYTHFTICKPFFRCMWWFLINECNVFDDLFLSNILNCNLSTNVLYITMNEMGKALKRISPRLNRGKALTHLIRQWS